MHHYYQVALTRKQQRDLFGHQIKLPRAYLSTTNNGGFTLSKLSHLMLKRYTGRKAAITNYKQFKHCSLRLDPTRKQTKVNRFSSRRNLDPFSNNQSVDKYVFKICVYDLVTG